MPARCRNRIGCRRLSHELKSADHAYPCGVGCPNGEPDTGNAIDRYGLRTQAMRQSEVPAFVEQMQIKIAEQEAE